MKINSLKDIKIVYLNSLFFILRVKVSGKIRGRFQLSDKLCPLSL